MAIASYEFRSVNDDLRYSPAPLGPFNLIVGATGSGKSRWLDSLWNLGASTLRVAPPPHGHWRVRVGDGVDYEILVEPGPAVKVERLSVRGAVVLSRDARELRLNDAVLPDVSAAISAAAVFGLGAIQDHVRCLKRNFHEGDQETWLRRVEVPGAAAEVERFELSVHAQLGRLRDEKKHEWVEQRFRAVFPWVEGVEVRSASEAFPGLPPALHGAPFAFVREHGTSEPIPASELASGMKKALLVLTDLAALPEGWLYVLDEIENSLGPGALEPMVEFLQERRDLQVLVSSHHPYLIGNVPPEQWLVFGREGLDVTIRSGAENRGRYGRSRQDWFVQLQNDPFYRGDQAAK